MRIFSTLVAVEHEGIFSIDTIEHQEKLWLVAEWIDGKPKKGFSKPARIICLERLQLVGPREDVHGDDYILNGTIPKSVLEGHIPQNFEHIYQIIERPEIIVDTQDKKLHENMTRQIPDIEESLQLCKDMDSPSVVIPVSKIAKYFPSLPPPGHSDLPCYDLGDLKAWAEEKGWSVTFATTGTLTDKRMVPGIRFAPLLKKDFVPNPTENISTSQTNNEPAKEKNWQNKILVYIAVGVIIVILGAFSLYLIRKHFGIPL